MKAALTLHSGEAPGPDGRAGGAVVDIHHAADFGHAGAAAVARLTWGRAVETIRAFRMIVEFE